MKLYKMNRYIDFYTVLGVLYSSLAKLQCSPIMKGVIHQLM